MLILENINLKEIYEKDKKAQNQNKVNMSTISNNTIYQISPDEYEEYENLRRNRDDSLTLIIKPILNEISDEKQIKNDYLGQIFNKTLKKLNYKISSDEQMLSFALDTESNELVFETSKGANRFLEQNNIEISIINEEYEKMKEKIKSKMKVNKLESRKTRKSLQEELKDKENKERI